MESDLTPILMLGVGGSILGLVGLLERRGQSWLSPTAILAILFAVGALGVAVTGRSPIDCAIASGLAVIGLLARTVQRFPESCGRLTKAMFGAHRLQAAAVLTMAPLLAFAWSFHDWSAVLGLELPEKQGSNVDKRLEELPVSDRAAQTDRGRSIPLYSSVYHGATDAHLRLDEQRMGQQMVLRAIRTSAPDPNSNCHGWVFTGGRFYVKPQSIAVILEDNGYEFVTEPRSGDAVIYRNSAGRIIHSGIVRMCEHDLILVESKWGALGRYLHSPADQVYATSWAYYRSARSGHIILGDWSQPTSDPFQNLRIFSQAIH